MRTVNLYDSQSCLLGNLLSTKDPKRHEKKTGCFKEKIEVQDSFDMGIAATPSTSGQQG
jgi:hypothetical protein